MSNLNLEIQFKELPYWRGIMPKPTEVQAMPFALTWDSRGFIRQVTPGEIQKKVIGHYASEDYQYITAPPGSSPWANRLGDAAIDFVNKSYGAVRGKKVLEIGAGSLYTANKLLEAGAADYTILDPGIKETSKNEKIQIIKNYFGDDTRPKEKFDLVVSVNCLEHVEDPVNFLVNLQIVLSNSKGQAALIFPDTEQQFRNGDLNVVLHEHLNYFTKNTAVKLLENCGFKVHQAETSHDRLFVLVSASDASKVRLDLPMDEILPLAAMTFQRSLEHIVQKVETSLAKNEKVAFHGANNGLNNGIFLGGILKQENILVFDSDESKMGKFIPAFKHPIHYAKDLNYKAMDKVFISALSFYPEIRDFLISKVGIKPSSVLPLFPMV